MYVVLSKNYDLNFLIMKFIYSISVLIKYIFRKRESSFTKPIITFFISLFISKMASLALITETFFYELL